MSEVTAAEKVSRAEMIALLRSIADAMDSGEPCVVNVGRQEINVPVDAEVEVEYERDGDSEELEIELTWTKRGGDGRNLRAKAGIGLALTAGAIAGGAALLQYLQQHRRPPESASPDLKPVQLPDSQE
jgi:amphi-Trp domain-containing protein